MLADRMLLLLQNALFLAGIAVWVLMLAPDGVTSEEVGDGPHIIWTYPDGTTAQEFGKTGTFDQPLWVAIVLAAILSLWSFGLGAVLFCLRRIGGYLREREAGTDALS